MAPIGKLPTRNEGLAEFGRARAWLAVGGRLVTSKPGGIHPQGWTSVHL